MKRKRGNLVELTPRDGKSVIENRYFSSTLRLKGLRGNLSIENCRIPEIIFEDCHFDTLTIKSSIVKNLQISPEYFQATTGFFKIDSCVMFELRITESRVKKEMKVTNSRILSSAAIKMTTGECLLERTHFPSINLFSEVAVRIKSCGTQQRPINHVLFDESARLVEIVDNYIRNFVIYNFRAVDRLNIISSKIDSFNLTNRSKAFIGRLAFNSCSIKSPIHLEMVELKEFEISGDAKGAYQNEYKELKFSSPYKWERISLSDAKFDLLSFEGLSDSSGQTVIINQITPKQFFISDCIFANTTINKLDLFDSELKILRSSVVKMTVHSIVWPRDHSLVDDIRGGQNDMRVIADQRETYRQLKVLSIDANNKIDAQIFQKRELNLHYRLLAVRMFPRIRRREEFAITFLLIPVSFQVAFLNLAKWIIPIKRYSLPLRDKYYLFQDFLILHTNVIFSNFGESLKRPILWLLFLHTVLFWRLICSFPEFGIETTFTNLRNHNWAVFWDGFSLYINLLSPVHDADVPITTVSTVASQRPTVNIFGTIDFFMRLVTGYFIYYFIKATRKFNFSI
ncbi:MAG TPA: hypothetical protein VIU12_30180 [Chryseolinea sp.]